MERLLIMLTWGGVVQSLPSYEPLTPNISALWGGGASIFGDWAVFLLVICT